MEPLKDQINIEYISKIHDLIMENGGVQQDTFLKITKDSDWEMCPLKQRITIICHAMKELMPFSYAKQAGIIEKVSAEFGGLHSFVFPEYIMHNGIDDPVLSLKVLGEITKYGSSEFAVRPFIEKHYTIAYPIILDWSKSTDEHQRRLASEGTRPYLPWAAVLRKFVNDPTDNLKILEELKNDPSKYVQKSVANHLNDLSKDHPDLVIQVANKWGKDQQNTRWILKHGMRTLLKSGYIDALTFFDFKMNPKVFVNGFNLFDKKVRLGDRLMFDGAIESKEEKKILLRLEYNIYFKKASGKLTPKIFQLYQKEIHPGEIMRFSKKHLMKQLSTRKMYAGVHEVGIVINGKEVQRQKFEIYE